ncbi:hypothetical protein KUCAC02_017098 [Chaenocephalus aceratus]|uniref:Uncharacterized protein n=1 Tax=Chaenocephalus aceratus TaxID=36190 RepID=A0ACB9W0T7_CHAAC|nr:hypothetical protein KUCAC02_017098 [Chaenocephalus aceratus]
MMSWKRVKDGYVDGVDAGEDASLQAGFDLGFREGATQTVAVGRLKGIVSAIWCWCQTQHPESPLAASVTHLLQQVSQHEDTIMEGIKNTLENPPPSVSAVSESMEDLEVEQANPGCEGEDVKNRLLETLKYLLQRCMDLVSELGLPEELVSHIQELNNM